MISFFRYAYYNINYDIFESEAVSMKRKAQILAIAGTSTLLVAGSLLVVPKISHAEQPQSETTQTENTTEHSSQKNTSTVSGTTSQGITYENFSLSFHQLPALIVDEILAETGDEVTESSAILTVTKESYDALYTALKKKLRDASSTYETAKITYETDLLTLQSTYAEDQSAASLAYDTYINTLEQLALQVSQAETDYENAKEIINTYPNKIKNAKKTLKQYKAKAKQYKTKLEKASKEYEAAKQVLSEAESKLETAKSDWEALETVQQYIDNYTKEHTEDSNNITTLSAKLLADATEKKAAYEEAQEAYNKAKTAYETAEASFTKIENTYTSTTNKVTSLQTKISNYKETYQTACKNIKALKNTYQQAVSKEEKETISAKETYEQKCFTTEAASTNYQTEKESIEETLEEAKEAYEDAKEALETLEEGFTDYTWYAKSSGTLSYIAYEAGQRIESNTAILGYADSSVLTVTFSIDQTDIASYNVGDSLSLQTSNMRNRVTGTIAKIESVESTGHSSSVTFNVTVTIDNADGNLSTGETVSIQSDMMKEDEHYAKEN